VLSSTFLKDFFVFFSLKLWVSQTCEVFVFFLKKWGTLQSDLMVINQDFLLSWCPNKFYKTNYFQNSKHPWFQFFSPIGYNSSRRIFFWQKGIFQSNVVRHISIYHFYWVTSCLTVMTTSDILQYNFRLPKTAHGIGKAFEIRLWNGGGRSLPDIFEGVCLFK
jgi:hypothetical protein